MADKIVVAIDLDRKTWSGNTFLKYLNLFFEIKEILISKQNRFYFDVFYLPELTPMENESRERNMALSKLGGMENSIVDLNMSMNLKLLLLI
jgi:hypothetical protein